MILKKLGNTDIQLSAVGFGAWAVGGGGYRYGWGPQDDKDSIATIQRALELGINWIDTAPVYGEGHSEEVVGEAIKGMRDNVFISTKCGLWMDEKKEDLVVNLNKESIRSEVEASLKKLQTDVIDLYQLHAPMSDKENEIAWRVLAELIKEGKIRYAGASNFSIGQLKHIQAIHPVSFIQPEYSMLAPSIEYGMLDYCAAEKIGVIGYSPMYRGLLTGKMTKERVENLPPDDNRLILDNYKEPFLSANLQLLERLRPIADRNNKTLAQLAIAWTLRRPGVTSAIVGARKPSQIEETVAAGDWVLSEADKSELDSILEQHYMELKKLRGEGIDYMDKKLQKGFDAGFSPESDLQYAIDIYGSAGKEGLKLYFNYNKYEYDRATMEAFSDLYKKNLQKVIEHCVEKKKEIQTLGKTPEQYYIEKDYETYLDKIKQEQWTGLSVKNNYKHILQSGGTGFLGAHMVAEFLEKTGASLYLPIRGKTQEVAEERFHKKMVFYFGEDFYNTHKNRFTVIRSDLSEDRMGMENSQYEALAEKVDAIVHPAANVKHHGAYEELHKDNVVSTEQLLELAVIGKKKDFHYVSTISVGEGNIPGREYILYTEYCNDIGMTLDHIYLKSKFEAEKRVLTYREKGINGSIYRVGNLIFHSDTGKFQENIGDDYFYNIIKGAIKLKMLSEHMREKMVFDMSFINYTARGVVSLLMCRGLTNQTYHVLNPNTLPMTEMAEYLKDLGFNLNELNAGEEKDYLAKFEGNSEYEKIIELLKIHSWVFEEKEGTQATYKMDRTVMLLEKLGLEWPKTDKQLVEKMIAHCKEVGFL